MAADVPLWVPIVTGVCGLLLLVLAAVKGRKKDSPWWFLAGGAAVVVVVISVVMLIGRIRKEVPPPPPPYNPDQGPPGPTPLPYQDIPEPKPKVQPGSAMAFSQLPGTLTAMYNGVAKRPKYYLPDRRVPTGLGRGSYETEAILELILCREVQDRYRPKGQQADPNPDMATRIGALEALFHKDAEGFKNGIKTAIGKDAAAQGYGPRAYSQWYCLLALGMREDQNDWANDGGATKHFDFLKNTITAGWGNDKAGELYADGSVVATPLYVLLQLHANNHWANGEVGQRLGTPLNTLPKDNPKTPDERPFVVMLRRSCALYESFYPRDAAAQSRPTIGAPYGRTGAAGESGGRAGSKILYLLAKWRLADEELREADIKTYRDACRQFFANLDQQLVGMAASQAGGAAAPCPIPDTYTLAYVMRALALCIQYESQLGHVDRVLQLGGVGDKLLEALERGHIKSDWSSFYPYLAVAQYRAQVGEAVRLAATKAAGGPAGK